MRTGTLDMYEKGWIHGSGTEKANWKNTRKQTGFCKNKAGRAAAKKRATDLKSEE